MYGKIFPPAVIDELERSLEEARAAVAGLPPEDAYRRRTLWMIDGMTNYVPTTSMYAPQSGFIAEAKQTQKYIGKTPRLTALFTNTPPAPSLDDPAWEKAEPALLVRGAKSPQFSAENCGFPADIQTQVKALHDNDNLYICFHAEGAVSGGSADAPSNKTIDAHLGEVAKERKIAGDPLSALSSSPGKREIRLLNCSAARMDKQSPIFTEFRLFLCQAKISGLFLSQYLRNQPAKIFPPVFRRSFTGLFRRAAESLRSIIYGLPSLAPHGANFRQTG